MEKSSKSPNFVGVVNLKKTSMASSRDYLAHKRKIRKDSPFRRSSELPLSLTKGVPDRKDNRRRIKVNNVLESRANVPEVFRIAPLTPQTNEETTEGKTRACSRNDTNCEEKEGEKRDQKVERLPSTDSQYLRARTGTSCVTEENQVS